MKLAAVREALATEISAVTTAEVAVVDFPPDQLHAPAVFLLWGTPWLELHNRCSWVGNIDVLLVTSRFEPAGAIDTLESLTEQILPLLAGGRWRFGFLEAPGPLEVAGVTYLSARLTISTDIDN